jgi:tetraacyldisaccharide 4'-kinase
VSGGDNGVRRRDRFVSAVLHGEDRGIGATLLRSLVLAPLAVLHQAGLEAFLLPYRAGTRKRYRLPAPVIAIGNLSSGGTGKTPMAERVAAHLQACGMRVALVSRGHGGSGEAGRTPRIVSDGTRLLLGPDAAGDEPVLLASRLPGVPVVVGRDRRASGRLAMERFTPDVVLLDDALQYWQLHRDLDIVLLDAARPFDNGYVLPRGLLREAPRRLARAGIVVLTRADRVAPAALAENIAGVRRLAPGASIFTAAHAPVGWTEDVEAGDSHLPLDALAGKSALVFSGIADGAAFVEAVRALGLRVVHARDFGDHHSYTAEDVAALRSAAEGCDVVVATEKDLVKVRARWPTGGPSLMALRIEMRIDDEPRFWKRVEDAARPMRPAS